MKKTLLILFVILFTGTAFFAQSPGFKYQAVVRNASGAILQNQAVGLQISILQGSETGTSVYAETWNIETNDFGLVNLIIGEGDSGDDFSAITWGTDNYWVKIELDETGGTDYTEMGTSQLLSVPYALHSGSAWESTGDTLFCVKDDEGKPVFIVYPDGVEVIVDTSAVTKSGAGGRFLVSGRGINKGTKGPDQPVLVVQPAGMQVIVDTTAITKSGAGGRFLVSGRGINKTGKGTEMNFMDLTRKNYLIGHNVGSNITTGTKNSILGYEAGNSITTGNENTFIGYRAGYNSETGIENVFIGNFAGETGTGGIGNVNIGFGAGRNHNHDAGVNVYVGYAAGYSNTAGENNIYIGYSAGGSGTSGTDNVYLGTNTGKKNLGNRNVFLGTNVGSTIGTVNISDKLYIDNSETLTPLIWGDFVNDILRINGSLNVNNAYTFPADDGAAGDFLKTDGIGNLYWSSTKSLEKSEELILLKLTVDDQKSQIEKLIKENEKNKKDNKDFEERLKALEKIVNKK